MRNVNIYHNNYTDAPDVQFLNDKEPTGGAHCKSWEEAVQVAHDFLYQPKKLQVGDLVRLKRDSGEVGRLVYIHPNESCVVEWPGGLSVMALDQLRGVGME